MKDDIIPVCLPKLPLAKYIIPYLHQIDQNRWYTNYGPLTWEFLSRIAALFHLDRSNVICATNGTVMLELCLNALKVPKDSLCIMPSWTFVATALAAVNANMNPYFVDVDKKTHTIHPDRLINKLSSFPTHKLPGAIIVVMPFGMPVDVKSWDNFTEQTGIPVIIDAAAGFDTALKMPQMKPGKTPVMISLHATKVLGIGEAAFLVSQNEELVSQIQSLTQFGFPKGVRNAECFGTNAKISEYTSAVGLAALDRWIETREGWHHISNHYQKCLNQAGISHIFTSDWVSSTCNILLPEFANHVATILESKNIMTRKWYGNGCHQHSAFKHFPADDLTNTEYLANSMLGLPFYIGMELDIIEKIVDTLADSIEMIPRSIVA